MAQKEKAFAAKLDDPYSGEKQLLHAALWPPPGHHVTHRHIAYTINKKQSIERIKIGLRKGYKPFQ